MVYDSARGKVVMFGGNEAGFDFLNETWEYDGGAWTQVTTASSPDARRSHAMVYDSGREKTVMHAGRVSGSYLDDTWEYDGVDWTQQNTAYSPLARYSHAMAYDSARGETVMFGGYAGGWPQSDDYEYEGVTWSFISTATIPNQSHSHAMAYDSARGQTVMFGGAGFGSHGTWEYDGADWTEITTAGSPIIRADLAMVYDSARGKMVMFGGFKNNNFFNDTWEYGLGEVSNYCTPTVNSTGSASTISAIGSTSVGANNLVLTADNLPSEPGIFIAGPMHAQIPFFNGLLCIHPSGLQRFSAINVPSSGSITQAVDIVTSAPGGLDVVVGSSYHYQRWNRDPAGGGGNANFSDGLEVQYLP